MRGGPHAKADADRQCRMALDPRHRSGDLGGVRRRGAGDAGDRHVINEARRIREHRGQPFFVGGRSGEPDEIKTGFDRRQA